MANSQKLYEVHSFSTSADMANSNASFLICL